MTTTSRHGRQPGGGGGSISSLSSSSREGLNRYRQLQLEPYPVQPQVDYVLLAEFDIDQGSLLRHQYPAPTGTDQHLLAEHMLPDGAHDRPEDWTVFYLNQIPALTVDPSLLSTTPEGLQAIEQRKERNRLSMGIEGDEAEEEQPGGEMSEGGGLLYVMSLVRTKKDATVRRGALVKALAVATRNPYIQIYKPILLLALEDYFSTPSISVLARLYNAINQIETPSLPRLTLDERTILRGSDRKDVFEEKFGLSSSMSARGSNGYRGSGGGTGKSRRDLSRERTRSNTSLASNITTGTNRKKTSQDESLNLDTSQTRLSGSISGHHQQRQHQGGGGGGGLSDDDDDSSVAEVLSPTSITTHGSSSPRIRSSGSISSLASTSRDSRGHPNPSSRPPSTSTMNNGNNNASTDDLLLSQSRSRANTVTSSEGGGGDGYSQQQRDFLYSNALPHPPLPTSSSSSNPLPSSAMASAGKPKDTHWYETKVAYGGINLPIRIPLATFPSEIGEYSLINLIQTFSNSNSLVPSPTLHPSLHTSGSSTPAIILLFNALITSHRVVFLGHGQPAGKVAELVLAACALASGSGSVLKGFEERAFPYTNLSNLDNLENVPGYIAGVCNPAFADRPSWWDVLCNIETGKITVSKDLRPVPIGSRGGEGGEKGDEGGSSGKDKDKDKDFKGETSDQAFMDEILHAIQAHYGESVIRARFAEYANRFVRLASRHEEESSSITSIGFPCAPYREGRLGSGLIFGDEVQGTRELSRDVARIQTWMATKSYNLYQQQFRQSLEFAPLRDFDLVHQLSRLRQGRQLSTSEIYLVLQTLVNGVRTEEQIIALLAHLPSHFGGLLPLSFGLFHPLPAIRSYTLDLFDQIGSNPTGRKYLSALNAFQRSAYNRLSIERAQVLQQQRQAQEVARQQQQQQQHQSPFDNAGGGGRDREATVTLNNLHHVEGSQPGQGNLGTTRSLSMSSGGSASTLPPPVPNKDG